MKQFIFLPLCLALKIKLKENNVNGMKHPQMLKNAAKHELAVKTLEA